jgi:hypothetical protein
MDAWPDRYRLLRSLTQRGPFSLHSGQVRAVQAIEYVEAGQSVAWTAVSRSPYLKAVAYYPQRRAGGWFLNQNEYCVPGGNSGPDDRESPEVSRVVADLPVPSLYGARLLRGGWGMEDLRAKFARRIDYVKPARAGWELRHSPQEGYRLSQGRIEPIPAGGNGPTLTGIGWCGQRRDAYGLATCGVTASNASNSCMTSTACHSSA